MKENSKDEVAMTGTSTKETWPEKARFKGLCTNCGKQGHKGSECRGGKKSENGSSKAPGDKSKVTCYNCQVKGHYANKCPLPSTKTTKPDKDKEDNNELGMFVGGNHPFCVLG
jgi:hypothetical protein